MNPSKHNAGICTGLALAAVLASSAVYPLETSGRGEGHDHHATHHHHGTGHEHHRQMLQQSGYRSSVRQYEPPNVTLVDQHSRAHALDDILAEPRALLLNFIFTTCTTICPVLSASFTQAQDPLSAEAGDWRMISITIDPEHDSPERLRRYAERFRAGERWDFYTGDRQDIIRVQKAFDAFRGDKMSHVPLTFLRAAPGEPWLRVEGFANAGELVDAYRAERSRTQSR